jgi:hypothetical protein
VGLLAALYSFIGLNLGGFFLGMLFGIIGGALVIAWGPPRVKPVNPDFVPIADQLEEAASTSDDASTEAFEDAAPADAAEDADPADAETEHVEIAGHDDRPAEERVRPAATPEAGIVPGFDDDREGPKSSRLSRNPKALTVALIVIGLTAGLLAIGSRVPARADDACPAGLPSATSTATSTTAAAEKAAAGTARTASGAATSAAAAASAAATAKKAPAKTGTEPAPSASPGKSGSGNSIVDGVKGIIDGVGNLLGLGDDPSSTPSASPSPSATAEPTKTGAPVPTASEPTKTAGPTTTAGPTKADGSTPASASPSASDDVIPCLGARVFGLEANPDGVPPVAAKAGLLETDSLTMYNSTYGGVVNLRTGAGTTIRVLKLGMTKTVNKPFHLTIDEPDGGTTVITSNELATIGNVQFYTERFEGKLFGVFPLVFTPDQPPPLLLPLLWFTDVKVELNYVSCDKLTGIPLQITEKK